MKKLKKIGSIIFYVVIVTIVVYVIYVVSGLELAKPIDNRNVAKTQKEETTTTQVGRREENKKEKEPNPEFQEYIDNIRLNNIYNYTTTYDNIELFTNDDLFRDAYTKATVFTFVTNYGHDLISQLNKISIYNSKETLTPVYQCFDLGDDVLIIAVVDNDKLSLLQSTSDPLTIKLECIDSDNIVYETERNFVQSIPVMDKEGVNAGELFKLDGRGIGLRLTSARNADATLREDVVYNKRTYEFTTSIDIFTFGEEDGIDAKDLRLEYTLPEGLEDFSDIKFKLTSYKMHSNKVDSYNGENKLLAKKSIEIFGIIDNINVSDEVLSSYKDVINNATLVIGDYKLPLKEIIITENEEKITDIK